MDIGGRDINEYLMELLKDKIVFTTTFEREFARDIKEQCCQVRNFSNSRETNDKSKYCLPDGKIIELVNEKTEAPEILFNTTLIERDGEGI